MTYETGFFPKLGQFASGWGEEQNNTARGRRASRAFRDRHEVCWGRVLLRKDEVQMRTRAKRRGSTIYRLMIAVEAPDWSHDEEASELLHKAFEATNYHVFTEDVLSMPDESGSAQSCASILLWPRRRDLDEAIKLAVATISPLVLQHCDLGDDPLDREVIRVLVQQEVFSNAFAPAEARPSGRTGSKRVRK